MLYIETSETKLTEAETRVLSEVLNDETCGPTHIQSKQLRCAKSLVRKGYLRFDTTPCDSGGHYASTTTRTVLAVLPFGKEIHVAPRKSDNV